jgi:lambda family phage tail tape measure protein
MRSIQGIFGGMGFGGASPADSLASGITPVALGGAFSGGSIIPFARGGVVSRPTMFPMANGAGLMGEAGPEAVMPLRRGADGKLGVAATGGGGAAGGTSISFGDINITVPEGTSPSDAGAIARAVKDSMIQVADERMMYHMRQRGYLNNAA